MSPETTIATTGGTDIRAVAQKNGVASANDRIADFAYKQIIVNEAPGKSQSRAIPQAIKRKLSPPLYKICYWRGENKMSFIGRKEELESLTALKKKGLPSLVCVLGRRRIGKSAIIQEFGKSAKNYFEIQGLGPKDDTDILPTTEEQLVHVDKEISARFKVPQQNFKDWDDAFEFLSKCVAKGEWVVLLDEISWLGGSVSAWIENNILESANFLGRVSLALNVKELSLAEINEFFKSNNYHYGQLELMTLLSITGGVPKSLEELVKTKPSDEAIAKLKMDHNSDLTEALHILELSGFLERDFVFDPENGRVKKASRLRVKDNYTRFYLKIIEPLSVNVLKGGKKFQNLSDLKNLSAIRGYQFENIILANKDLVHKKLNIKNLNMRSPMMLSNL